MQTPLEVLMAAAPADVKALYSGSGRAQMERYTPADVHQKPLQTTLANLKRRASRDESNLEETAPGVYQWGRPDSGGVYYILHLRKGA